MLYCILTELRDISGGYDAKFFVFILNAYHKIKLENLREYLIFQSIL